MAQIFISYSTLDQATADDVVAWLKERGYSVFQSGHAERGIPIGAEWEKTLYWQLSGCRVFMPLLSQNWLASDWCHAELRISKSQGKAILPVKLAACDASGVSSELQAAQLYLNEADARARIAKALGDQLHRRGGLLAPGQPLFPGLTAFSEAYAPVFFGRDTDVARLAEAVRRAANAPAAAGPRTVILTGSSGVGKSSVVRAGLIPDLAADPPGAGFLVLGPIRPRDGLDGGPESLARALARLIAPPGAAEAELLAGLAEARTLIDTLPGDATPLARRLGDLVAARQRHGLLVFVDQAEELRVEPAMADGPEALLRSPQLLAVALFAVREDRASPLRTRFGGDDPVQLLALPREGLGEAIRGPLQLAGRPFEEAFVDEMLRDAAAGADPMPLMAQVLALMEKQDQGFTLAAYEAAGRLAGAIERAAETAFAATISGDEAQAAARRVFVPGLAEPSLSGEVRLGRLPLDRAPALARPLIDRFVADRLFREGVDGRGGAYVEPAHEALLRGWPRLAGWIEAEQETLIVLGEARRDTAAWADNGRGRSFLLHTEDRLKRAMALQKDEAYAEKLAPEVVAYLDACSDRDATEAAEKEAQEARVARSRALIFTAEAAKASDAWLYERAMRFGLAGWSIEPDSVPELKAELTRAAFARSQLTRMECEAWVRSTAFSPDGTKLVTASDDKTARVWEAASGREIARLQHEDRVKSAAFSPDGTKVVTGSDDETARVWEAAEGREITRLRHTSGVNSVAFSPDGTKVVTASDDKTARVWAASTGREIARLPHKSGVNSAAFSPDGTKVATASDDKTARVWDASSGREIARWRHQGRVNSASFSPDGSKLITASWFTAWVWEAESGHEIARMQHEDLVLTAAFSPDGTEVVTASRDDKTARVWEVVSSRVVGHLQHEAGVQSAAFSPDGTEVITGSKDRTARVWEVASGRETSRLHHEDGVQSAAFSPNGTKVVTASSRAASVWETASSHEIARLQHEDRLNSAALSPNGAEVVTGSIGNTARVWDAASGREIACRWHMGEVNSTTFSPDGTKLLTGSNDKTARVWEQRSGRIITHLRHKGRVNSAAFSHDGTKVVTASDDKTARVWETASGREIARLQHEDRVKSAAFSPDGTKVVTGSDDETARVWEAADGREITRLQHSGQVNSAAFSPDGTKLVTASWDAARIWDVASGSEILRLQHEHQVNSAAFSPDGTKVITASQDAARIWDTASGREITHLEHKNRVTSAAFSSDGRAVVTASWDKTARIWDTRFASGLTGDALIEAICREKLIGAERFTPEDLHGALLPDPPPNPVAACLALLEQRRAARGAG